MAVLEIRLFGPPRVLRGDAEVRFDTRKAIALIAVLAVEGGEHARESLAALLWPELDRQHSRAALRRTLSVASAAVPEVVADGSTVRLDTRGVRCDVLEFRALVGSDSPADWAAADGLVRGPFLDGFALRDSPLFDDWQFALASSLRDDASLALALLVDDAVRRGDLTTALGLARRRIETDALSEPAYADLIRIAAWSGDRPGALRAYRELVALLERDLGVAPLPATAGLDRAVRDGTLPPPPRTAPRTASPPVVLGGMVQQVVEAAYVLGTSDRDLLRAVAGRSESETSAAVEEAVRMGLLRADPRSGRIRADDSVVLDLHRAPPPLPRLRLLHARAADALIRRHAAGPAQYPADEVARHLAAAGRDDDAATWFVTAARAAHEGGENERALAALRSAVALGRNTLEVQIEISQALTRLGRVVEALVVLGQAAESAAADETALIAARQALAIVLEQGDRDGEVALRSHLADLLHAAGEEDEARAEQQRWAATFAAVYGRPAPPPWALAEA